MRHRLLPICLTLLFLAVATAASGDRISLREAGFQLMETYEEDGYTMRNEIEIGLLFPGEPYYFEMQMSAGIEYVVAASGSEDVTAMKLEVFDENYNMVTADVRLVREVSVTFTPEWTGTYFFRLTMVDCPDNGAHWFVIKGYR